MAGSRETEGLKPIDKAILGDVSESSGRNESEHKVASKVGDSGGRARFRRAKTGWTVEAWLKRLFAPAGW